MQKLFTVVTIVLLILWIPLGLTLHENWGWENNFIENSQLVIIALGAWASFCVSRNFESKTKMKRFWLWSIGVWLICFARELSWGRSLFPTNDPGESPVFYTLDELSFGPWVHYIVAVCIIVVTAALIYNFDWRGFLGTTRIPWFLAVACVFSAILSNMFEQECFPLSTERATVLEEFGESVMWWALLGVIACNIVPKNKEQETQ